MLVKDEIQVQNIMGIGDEIDQRMNGILADTQ